MYMKDRVFRNIFTKMVSVAIIFMLTIGNPQMVPDVQAQSAPVIDPLPNVTGSIAGYLGGGFGVNEAGSANYTIDLAVPPGTGGVTPKLSLAYDSRGRNSVLGLGWSLTGLSAITRCSTTIAQDGFIDGVDFDNNDKFCLDGQRLVAINGTYGANGTEYRTENETFAQIFSYGVAGSGPERFVVKTKSGLIYSYGLTPNARVEARGKTDVLIWHADKVADTVGNYFTVTYHEDNSIGESYPLRIDYTGNTAKGLSPYNSVQFSYEPRNDVIPSFLSGSMIKLTKRLKKILMYTGPNLAWEYNLTYHSNNDSRFSRLVNVNECGGDGSCLPSTTFVWQEGENGFQPQALWDTSSNNGAVRPYWTNPNGQLTSLTDINGDGLSDRAFYYNYDTNSRGLWVALNNGNGFGSKTLWLDEPTTNNWNQPELISDGSGSVYAQLQDMNGDGFLDRVSSNNFTTNRGGLWVALNNGTGFSPKTLWYSITTGNQHLPQNRYEHGLKNDLIDMNGDGRLDHVSWYNYLTNKYGLWVALNNGNGFNAQQLWFTGFEIRDNLPLWVSDASGTIYANLQDMNGDGLPDRISTRHAQTQVQGMWVALNNGQGFDAQVNWWADTSGNQYTPLNQYVEGIKNRLIDMNGDGLPDNVFHYDYATASYGMYVALNNGSGFEPKQLWFKGYDNRDNMPHWISDGSGNIYGTLMDINGDGLPDKVSNLNAKSLTAGMWVALNNGRGFDEQVSWWSSTAGGQHLVKSQASHTDTVFSSLHDMDGDARLDHVAYYNYGTAQYGLWVSKNKQKSQFIKTITNGNGAMTTIEYAPLTDKNIYTKYTNATYPAQDLQGPMYVVKAYETDNGLGGKSRMSYQYEGLKATLDGRGFCGFQKITATNQTTGIKTATFYRQNHPFKSKAFKKEVRLSDNTLINRTEDTWSVKQFATFPNERYFPHVTSSVIENYEIDGSLVNTTTTNMTFDDFGNTTQITVAQSDGHSETTVNTYTNDTINWFLGRLTTAQVTKQAPGQVASVRKSSFAYDAITGILNEETIEPNHPTLWSKKKYTHDGFGNILTSTVTGPNISARTQRTSYDTRGQFVVQSTNTLGHTETKAYDARHGTVTSLTGPNGITTTWVYDSFGRQTNENRADGTKSRTLTLLADASSPVGAKYFIRTDSSGAAPAIVYYDILDREIRRETVGFNGTKIFVDTQYNARGEVVKTSDPYFAGTTPVWTVNEYDTIGRLTKVTSPGNRISRSSYNGFTTTVTNPNNQTNTRTINSLEQLVQSRDNLNNTISYTYDSNGNLIQMRDSAGNLTTMQYDIVGNKTSMRDPDSGTTTYVYDSLGQLKSQTDAKGQTATFVYDDLGRMVSRTEDEGTSLWTYDTVTKGIGKPASVISANGHEERYAYDSLGRPTSTTTTIDGVNYVTSQSYDQYGRVRSITYPSGFAVRQEYNVQGYLAKVVNDATGQLYWQGNAINARGQWTNQSLGNGLAMTKTFDALTGFQTSVQSGTIQHLTFNFDGIGNLLQRRDVLINAEENFTYDALNRLTNATVVGQTPLTMTYDDLGNITSNSDVGTYIYGENGAGVHAVTSIVGPKVNTYSYDANGNRINSNAGNVSYTSFNKPSSIKKGTKALEFAYNASRDRFKQLFKTNAYLDKKKIYVGDIYEEESVGASTKKVHYIRGGDSTVAIYTMESGLPDKTRYLHKDHLGSIHTISDELGNAVEVLSFDAWGNRRNANWSRATAPISSNETNRGFTGHEQLDLVNLIHMNGRVYDPVIGRFLSADPNIQAPENTQSLNRYSYVLNNPLSYTDPSGFFFKKIVNFIKEHKAIIAAVVVGFATGIWVAGLLTNATTFSLAALSNLTIGQAVLVGAASGFTGGVVGSVSAGGGFSQSLKAGLRGAAFGGISGGVFRGIGMYVPEGTAKILAHGASGGILNLAQGGKFHHGFIASSVVKLFGPGIETIGDQNDISVYRVAAATVLGGAVSELTGGKFANGAITFSFAQLFNGELSRSGNAGKSKVSFGEFKGLKLTPLPISLLGEGVWSYPTDVYRIVDQAFNMEKIALYSHEISAYDFGRRTGYAAILMRVVSEGAQFFYYSGKDVYARAVYDQAGTYQPYTLRGPGGIYDSLNDVYNVYLGVRDSNKSVNQYPFQEFNPVK